MKLNSPELIIPADNPFLNDKFNRKEYGESLFNLFKNVDDNIIVCLNSPWGEGKTTFIKMWLADLELNKGTHCIYFDAYKNDFINDPFIALCSEIINYSEKYFSDSSVLQNYKRDFKKTAISILKKLLVSGTKIGIKAATLGIINSTDIDLLTDLKDDLSSESSDVISSILEEKMNSYHEEKNTLATFTDLLSNIGKEIKTKQDFPLLIVIDELDRCRPDYALLLIEKIKHLFSVNNVSFLLLTNLMQLVNSVKSVYGISQDADALNYLQKFITITTSFPDKILNSFRNDYRYYIQFLCEYHGINDNADLESNSIPLLRHLNLSLREIGKCFTLMTLYYANTTRNNEDYSYFIILISILKIRYRDIYTKLLNKNLSYQELNDSLLLDSFKEDNHYSFDVEGFKDLLKYLLMSVDNFNKLSNDDKLKRFNQFFRNPNSRINYLPNLANKFEIYKMKP